MSGCSHSSPLRAPIVFLAAGLFLALWPSRGSSDDTGRLDASRHPHSRVQVLYIDDDAVACRDATPAEAGLLLRKTDGLELREISRTDSAVSALQATGLRIILRGTPQLEAFPAAKAAFLRAAAVWESLIRDPITIVIDVDYGPTRFGEAWPSTSVLGSTAGQLLGGRSYYGVMRDAIQARNPALPQLPASSLPTNLGSIEESYSPSPVLRAIGLISASADPANEPNFGEPPSIGFNSNFSFDVTPDDGVDPDRYDFLSVAVHEIGHALGFVSSAGVKELYPEESAYASAWDFFRLDPSVTTSTFGTAPRILSSGGYQAFFSGGSKFYLSTGRPDGTGGDGRQGSHWKDDHLSGSYIGIMDPTIAKGVRQNVTTADRLALRAMGYDIAASMPTISNARMSKTVPTSGCSPLPAAVSAFSSSDARVYAYFHAYGQAPGEVLTRVWYSPDGMEYARGSWSPTADGRENCFWAWIDISGTPAASLPGAWRFRVFSNVNTDVPYLDLGFLIVPAATPAPTIYNAMTTKALPDPLCSALPTPASAFLTTDTAVNLYYRVNGFQESEVLSVAWIDPAGSVFRRASWSPLSTQYSYYCMPDKVSISGSAAAQKTGTWRIKVWADRLPDIILLDTTFTISPASTDVSAGTWLLTSSARVQGAGAFWRTDLTIRNNGPSTATVLAKFLGHSGDGRSGPERIFSVSSGGLVTYRDVLSSLFGLTSDYGPILVRSSTAHLAVLAETFTPGGGGTYGQAVPALATSALISGSPKTILGIRQNSSFRTNLMLASAVDSIVDVDVFLMSSTGTIMGSKRLRLGPLSRAQLNVASDFDVNNLDGGAFVISSPTPGALVGAYASSIDAATADPRTLLPQ